MDVLRIEGGYRLEGEIPIHGAKNSALPLLAATLLPADSSRIENCPTLSDVDASMAILRHLGCRVRRQGEAVEVDASALTQAEIPDRLMREMRSSIVFLGAIIARCGQADLTYPGGCELGPRPIDLHLAALRRLGVHIEEEQGRIRCRVNGQLQGAEITLSFPSVGATENVLLAACTAQGVTVLHNAAREPEIQDLCAFLTACGGQIRRLEDGTLVIRGVPKLHGATHRVIPDRIEATTYLAAAAATGSTLTLRRCNPLHMSPVIAVLEEGGCRLQTLGEDTVTIEAPPRPGSFGLVRTMPHPGFPTDGGAPLLAAACVGQGTSLFIESIFENRFKYVDELARMGAHVRVDGRMAVVEGVPSLHAAEVSCTDLRGGAALVVAALAANGEARITQLQHLDRGYADLTCCLQAVGAHIHRVTE